MRLIGFRVLVMVVALLAWGPGAEATPTIGATPGSIATDATGAVTLDIGSLSGSSAILRLYVDANGNGSIDAGDEAIWTQVVLDDAPLWSPAQPLDVNGAAGAITVSVRNFGPFEFPYSAGTFIWEAEDSADQSTQTVAFSVMQTPQVQSVTGTVTNAADMQPIPGALAVLLQFCNTGEEAERLYTAFTNAAGVYDIEVPADLDCYKRIVVAVKPGFVTALLDQPLLTFTGSSNFTGQDVELTPGNRMVTGSVQYSSGPQSGNGIPGVAMIADSLGAPMASFAFADENGDYAFMLTDGDWEIGAPEGGLDARGAVRLDAGEQFTVSGGSVAVPTIQLPASNAYFQGVLRDRLGNPVAGRFVSADETSPCTSGCARISTVTDASGLFTLGVNAPAGPATGEFVLTIEDPLAGEIAEQLGCQLISSGDTNAGITLDHLTATGFVTGTVVDGAGVGTAGFCVGAWAPGAGCTSYTSSTVTGCDGSYALPVIDDTWNISMDVDGIAGFYGDYSSAPAGRVVTLPGDDPDGADFIIGPSRFRPHIVAIEPVDPQPGQRLLIEGYGLSFGTPPTVLFGATPAAVADFRPDQGFLFVDVPAGLAAGNVSVTVVNNDLGLTSEPYCLQIAAGPYVPACTISGTTTDGGGALAGVSMFVVDALSDLFGGHAISDGAGNYSVDLPAAGDYLVFMAPPEGSLLNWADYQVTCGNTQSHLFTTGFGITGRLVLGNNDPVEGALVQIEDTGTGYYTQVLTDENGDYTLAAPSGTYDFSFDSPPGSRILEAPGFQWVIAGNTDVGQNVAPEGSFFSGVVRDVDGAGVPAQVTGYDTSFMQRSGDAAANSCTGRFSIALPFGQFQLEIEDVGAGSFRNSTVKFAEIAGDTLADFDFTVFDAAVNAPQGPEPVILFVDPEPAGQAGEPLVIDVSNIAGTSVEVLFSDGAGGFVAGTSTETESERGLLLTRIPAGAATGALKVRVDGVDSEEFPFTRIPGSFPAGVHSVSGTVTGDGNVGALVALVRRDPADQVCDDDLPVADYTRTDGSGNYGPLTHLGGDIEVFVLPDAGSSGVNTGAFRAAVMTDITVDVTVPTGVPVSATVVDALANPVPNAVFEIGDSLRRTDANGDVTVHVTPGDYNFLVIPPQRSRLFEYEDMVSIAGALDLGDIVLDAGSTVSSAIVRRIDGSALAGVTVTGQQTQDPFSFWFETRTRTDGSFDGPIGPDSTFQVIGTPADDTLSDMLREGASGPDTDCILYPALAASPSGIVAGLVRDAISMLPLPGISVYGLVDDMGFPGDLSGFTDTCDDGTYRLKLAEGSHFLRFSDFQTSLYDTWYDNACDALDATPVSVTEGNTTTIDADLEQLGSISGVVLASGVPVAGASVCADSMTSGCQFCSPPTDGTGSYVIAAPPETDYRVQAFTGLGTQCYDGFDFCSGFTPVVVLPGTATTGIDFSFGCTMSSWYADTDLDGFGDPASTQMSCTMPGGFVGNNADCDDTNGDIFPNAAEINDGLDNQCPGDLGSGLVDELSGSAGFFNPGDKNEFSWPAQAGATMYEVARSDRADFSNPGVTAMTAATFFGEIANPASGSVFYYLARPVAPFTGNWGSSPFGPRGVNTIDGSDMEAWTSPTNLTSWFETTAAGVVEQETNPADVHEQLSAARLTRTVAAGALNIQKRQISLQPGFDHALQMKAKFDQAFSVPLYVRIFNFTTGEDLQGDGTTWSTGVNSFFFDLTSSYQTITLPFTTDPGFSTSDDIRVIVGHRGGTPNGSILWLDDVRVVER